MARLDEDILNFIRRYGPATPIEIAQKLGANSIIVSAVLIDAASQNKLMRSKRKSGSMKYYFYPEQLSTLQKKISNMLTPADKELLQKLMKENVIGEFELKPEEASAFSNLEDLIGGLVVDFKGTPVRCWYSPDMMESKAREVVMNKLISRFGSAKAAEVKSEDQKIMEQLASVQKVEKAKEAKIEKLDKYAKPAVAEKKRGRKPKAHIKTEEKVPAEKSEFIDLVYHWLEKQNIDVASERTIKAGKGIELEAKVGTPFGKQTYLIRIIDSGKKPVSQDEVSSIGMEAVSKRVPVIIVSSTNFAKNAKKYWEKELSDLVFLVSKDDLD